MLHGMTTDLSPVAVQIAVITVDAAVGEKFVATVCGAAGNTLAADGETVQLRLLLYRPTHEEEIARGISECDGVALLVGNIDALSLENLRASYRLLPNDYALPAAILILREQGKLEFKMSCPTCGQKLWVRDEDRGRNGRCPHCKKTFVLPAQTAHLKSVLMTPETIPLITVLEGNVGSSRGPIASLAERARRHAQALKSATMRVQLADGAADAPPSGT